MQFDIQASLINFAVFVNINAYQYVQIHIKVLQFQDHNLNSVEFKMKVEDYFAEFKFEVDI